MRRYLEMVAAAAALRDMERNMEGEAPDDSDDDGEVRPNRQITSRLKTKKNIDH